MDDGNRSDAYNTITLLTEWLSVRILIYAMRLLSNILTLVLLLAASITAQFASANVLEPVRSFNVKTNVSLRETVADAAIIGDKVHLLVTDRGPSGRTAILLHTDQHGRQQQWEDLKSPADSLVRIGDAAAAAAPIREGLRILQPTAGVVRATDLTGQTANLIGASARLIRLLGTSELAIHTVTNTVIGSARILRTFEELKVPEACAACGTQKAIQRGAYLAFGISGDRLAVVHRSSANIKILDLNTSRVIVSAVLDSEDIRAGREKFAKYQQNLARATQIPNPSLIISGAAHSSGDMFLLIGPFTVAEGARVIRVNAFGKIVATLRCAYPMFNPDDGPPRFLGLSGDDLYLISARGTVQVYRLDTRVP